MNQLWKAAGAAAWGAASLGGLQPFLDETAREKIGALCPGAGTVLVAAFPYYAGDRPGNLSLYSRGEDYHRVLRRRLGQVCQALETRYPGHAFVPGADSSPVPELAAAVRSGVGRVGRNGLLFVPPYGSYVFLGTVLTDLEVQGLFDIMRSLTAEGKGIVFISHKMREVMRISDRVTVLRRGETVETVRVADTTEQELADLMIGQKFVENTYKKVTDATKEEFVLKDVSFHPEIKHGGLKDVSLTIHKGEILGVAGIDGNGQTPLAEVVTGLVKPDSGKVIGPDGAEIAIFSPEAFIDAGLGNIPEDRNKMGLVGDMTIAENLVLKQTESDQFSLGHGKWLKMGEIHSYAERLREENDIRCTSVDQTARSLSGGNQQKVILARELEGHPKLLVAVYPTRGLDIGATEFIHNQIVAQRDAGCAVLLISADFDEVLKLSDRIVVLFEGQIMGTYSGANPPIKEISLAMAGK